MRLELVTAPQVEPITLAEAKQHLRATGADDALIVRLIAAARRHVEAHTRRRLITQRWRIYFDSFGECRYFGAAGLGLVLPDMTPAVSIESVKYIDSAGVLQTLAPAVYQLIPGLPPRLVTAYDQSWPDLRGDREGVRVEVNVGYGAAGSSVPDDILAAQLLLIGHLYENREATVVGTIVTELPRSVDALLSPYVVPEF